jgi:hypothetical protein
LQEGNAREVESEAIDGFHADGRVLALVILVFDPRRESAVERVEARQNPSGFQVEEVMLAVRRDST